MVSFSLRGQSYRPRLAAQQPVYRSAEQQHYHGGGNFLRRFHKCSAFHRHSNMRHPAKLSRILMKKRILLSVDHVEISPPFGALFSFEITFSPWLLLISCPCRQCLARVEQSDLYAFAISQISVFVSGGLRGDSFFRGLLTAPGSRGLALRCARRGQWLADKIGFLCGFRWRNRACCRGRLWRPPHHRGSARTIDQSSEQTLLARSGTSGGDAGVSQYLLRLVWLRGLSDHNSHVRLRSSI